MPFIESEHHLSNETFPRPPQVELLAVTTSTLHSESFSEAKWKELNAATTIAGGAALTCYSPEMETPIKYVEGDAKYRKKSQGVVTGTREAGHLTTRQHVNYLFDITGVSRLTTWGVLHSYPFYNSEQQSQRYVSMSYEGLMLPHLENEVLNNQLEEAGLKLVEGYHQLKEILIPVATEYLLARFPARNNPQWEKKNHAAAAKKAQEIARYVLPLGFQTQMYHSISELTLLRYHRLAETYDVGEEAKSLIDSMVNAVVAHDPSVLTELVDTIPLEKTPEFLTLSNLDSDPTSLFDQFDNDLKGSSAKIISEDTNIAANLAQAVRLTLNLSSEQLSDADAIALVLDPAQNPLLASTMGEITMNQLSQALNQANITAIVSLSHSADSQLQRHRGFDHTRPVNFPIPDLNKDIVIPTLIQLAAESGRPEILEKYLSLQQQNIEVMQQLVDAGVDPKLVNYLQTNATRIRKMISGPLGVYYHFLKSRTCLTAQEEIYDIAVSLTQQLRIADPQIGIHFDKPAPCGVRQKAGITPLCPEGKNYCGVQVWKSTIDDYPKRDI